MHHPQLEVTVGAEGTTFKGLDDLAIQAAIDYVAARGGGRTVALHDGTYQLHNSVRLRSGVRLVGQGRGTVLRKCASVTVPLTEDTDWYGNRVTVEEASGFRIDADGDSAWAAR